MQQCTAGNHAYTAALRLSALLCVFTIMVSKPSMVAVGGSMATRQDETQSIVVSAVTV